MKGRALTPEEELLLLIARLRLDSAQAARLDALLDTRLDWTWIAERGLMLRGGPLLHHHLKDEPRRLRVPTECLTRFADAHRRAAMKNLQIYGLLRRLLVALEQAEVPVILLKGAYLCRWVYQDIGLRPMGDLDLLFREQDKDRALRVMAELGGAPDPGLAELSDDDLRQRLGEEQGHLAPRYFGNIARVEPHLHLMESGRHPGFEDELWSQVAVHDWDGLAVKRLGAEHLLLHLASHLGHHLENEAIHLYWIADIRELMQGVAEPDLAALAERLGLWRECAEVFELIGIEGFPPPAGFWNRFTPLDLLRPHQADLVGGLSVVSALQSYLRAARGAGGPGAQLRFLLDVVFPSRAVMAIRHPGASRLALLGWYLLDPLIRVGRVMKGFVVYARRRFGH